MNERWDVQQLEHMGKMEALALRAVEALEKIEKRLASIDVTLDHVTSSYDGDGVVRVLNVR